MEYFVENLLNAEQIINMFDYLLRDSYDCVFPMDSFKELCKNKEVRMLCTAMFQVDEDYL
jgi:hypothetical protein